MAELRRPRLPRSVEAALAARQDAGEPQHPALAQGMLFGWLPRAGESGRAAEQALEELTSQSRNLRQFCEGHHSLLDAITQRYDALRGPGRVVEDRTLRLETRTVVGFGLRTQLETGFLLHPLYGVPYLPGSALKGVAQSFLLHAYAEEAGVPRLGRQDLRKWVDQNARQPTPLAQFERVLLTPTSEEKRWQQELSSLKDLVALSIEPGRGAETLEALEIWCGVEASERALAFQTLFGSSSRRGRVVYLDAFPSFEVDSRGRLRHLHIGRDVLTPHYSPFYSSASQALRPEAEAGAAIKPPGDHYDPVPVPFLVINPGSKFRVAVVAQTADQSEAGDTAKAALEVVVEALVREGIGAKTSSGYGRFEPPPP